MPLSHSAVMHFLTNKESMSGFGHERRTVWSKRKVSTSLRRELQHFAGKAVA